MGPISNIGPKTSRAARDRPELNLEAKFSRHNNLPEIVAGRRPRGGGLRHISRAAQGRTLGRVMREARPCDRTTNCANPAATVRLQFAQPCVIIGRPAAHSSATIALDGHASRAVGRRQRRTLRPNLAHPVATHRQQSSHGAVASGQPPCAASAHGYRARREGGASPCAAASWPGCYRIFISI
ncbi:GTP-binding protein Obg/CgtA [Dorcoceras hygrometricum]|uniref:GTP-binding protein Obg/CgtA n=1 Tax=Dorcoceras hygrometricum TaxID=472368 RepID=A0A2Z6ZXP0_9LAMI|nr:GTP-binding protein Obg/CgtA [Dorcoceras hygrometricum]